jgi:hypothetical protein
MQFPVKVMRFIYKNEVFVKMLQQGIPMQIIRQTLNFPDDSIEKGNQVTVKRNINGKTLHISYTQFPELEETLHKMVRIDSLSLE